MPWVQFIETENLKSAVLLPLLFALLLSLLQMLNIIEQAG